jgi:hypothetical protein
VDAPLRSRVCVCVCVCARARDDDDDDYDVLRSWRQNWLDFFASHGGVTGVVSWALPSLHGSHGDGVNWHLSRDGKAAAAAGENAFDRHHYV